MRGEVLSAEQPPPQRVVRVDLAYDGTGYSGWQVQPDRPTVQGRMVEVLERILGRTISLVGASRTDAGVHARGQVASFETDANLPVDALERALNSLLPGDIVVTSVRDAATGFHARFSAAGKRYSYRIRACGSRSPFDRSYTWWVSRVLDAQRMSTAAARLVGETDFTSFRASGC